LHEFIKQDHALLICGILFISSWLMKSESLARPREWFLNPGVKVGYAFGPNGGFIYGWEVSITSIKNDGTDGFGVFVSSESNSSISHLLHFGIEIFPRSFLGASLGPSLIKIDGKTKSGLGVTVFGGLLLLPYYRFTYIPETAGLHEAGTFFKMLIPLQKEKLSLGG
jgi:hypothetical protein